MRPRAVELCASELPTLQSAYDLQKGSLSKNERVRIPWNRISTTTIDEPMLRVPPRRVLNDYRTGFDDVPTVSVPPRGSERKTAGLANTLLTITSDGPVALIIPESDLSPHFVRGHEAIMQSQLDLCDFSHSETPISKAYAQYARGRNVSEFTNLLKQLSPQSGKILICSEPECVPSNYLVLCALVSSSPGNDALARRQRRHIFESQYSSRYPLRQFRSETDLLQQIVEILSVPSLTYKIRRGMHVVEGVHRQAEAASYTTIDLVGLFSPGALRHFRPQLEAAVTLYKSRTIEPELYHLMNSNYEDFVDSVEQGISTPYDLYLYHTFAFYGHMSDRVYRLLDRLAPDLLPENASISDAITHPTSLYLGLHIYDAETMFRQQKGGRKLKEHGVWSLEKIEQTAKSKQVVVRAGPGLAEYLIGSPINPYPEGSTLPGIYYSQGDKPYTGCVVLDPSYFSTYSFLKTTNLSLRNVKKIALALSHLTRFSKRPSDGKIGLQKVLHPNCPRRPYTARSALVHTFSDKQTHIRLRRTEAISRLRKLDVGIISNHAQSTQVYERMTSYIGDVLTWCSNKTSDSSLALAALKVLYPFDDAELYARTRTNYPVTLGLCQLHASWYGKHSLSFILRNCGGLGLQGLASVLMICGISSDHRDVMSCLIGGGFFSYGAKKVTKKIERADDNSASHTRMSFCSSTPYDFRRRHPQNNA